jgi:hypothetical protein
VKGVGGSFRDVLDLIAELTPILRGWGTYFRTGNADRQFTAIDDMRPPTGRTASGFTCTRCHSTIPLLERRSGTAMPEAAVRLR